MEQTGLGVKMSRVQIPVARLKVEVRLGRTCSASEAARSSPRVSPIAGGEVQLCGSGHSDQSAFWILEVAYDEPIG
jgi:hypothetical protein